MSETSPKEKKNPISKHSEQKPAQANMYADLKKHSVGDRDKKHPAQPRTKQESPNSHKGGATVGDLT
jgi:hypothetical protein